jgi:hypothetical protein
VTFSDDFDRHMAGGDLYGPDMARGRAGLYRLLRDSGHFRWSLGGGRWGARIMLAAGGRLPFECMVAIRLSRGLTDLDALLADLDEGEVEVATAQSQSGVWGLTPATALGLLERLRRDRSRLERHRMPEPRVIHALLWAA